VDRAPGQAQHRNRSVAILDISGLGFEDQAAPVRVDHDLALAALHLLARIVAARSTTLPRNSIWMDHAALLISTM
jgi:hypothetical protein